MNDLPTLYESKAAQHRQLCSQAAFLDGQRKALEDEALRLEGELRLLRLLIQRSEVQSIIRDGKEPASATASRTPDSG